MTQLEPSPPAGGPNAPSGPPVLPVRELIVRTYGQLVASFDGFVRIGLAWLILPLVLNVLASAIGDGGVLLGILGDIVSLLGLSAIAVVWHRHVLLGEPLAGPMAPVDRRVFKYLSLGVVVSLLAALPGFVLLTVTSATMGAGEGLLSSLILLAAAMVAILVFARLQLVFPGTAIGDPAAGLRGSWVLTRGNGIRLLSGILLTILPVLAAVLLAQLLGALFHSVGADKLGAFLALLAASVGGWLQAPLVAGFLSYAYLFFREVAPPAT